MLDVRRTKRAIFLKDSTLQTVVFGIEGYVITCEQCRSSIMYVMVA